MMMDATQTSSTSNASLTRAEELKALGTTLRLAGEASDMAEVERVDAELRTLLTDYDIFWIRWSYYLAVRRGEEF